MFLLREGLVSDFAAIARDMNEHDLVIRVEDASRTVDMQKNLALDHGILDRVIELVRWGSGQEEPAPTDISKSLKVLVALYPKTAGHMSGSAVDVSVLNMRTRKELDLGGSYLELSEKTPMDSPFIGTDSRRNRVIINEIFSRHGFSPYPFEFWHYSSGDVLAELITNTGRPARYGPVNFDVTSGSVYPVVPLIEALISPEELGFID